MLVNARDITHACTRAFVHDTVGHILSLTAAEPAVGNSSSCTHKSVMEMPLGIRVNNRNLYIPGGLDLAPTNIISLTSSTATTH